MAKPAQLDIFIKNWDRIHQQTTKLKATAPDEKYDWKPHETSMSLGELMNHLYQSEWGLVEAIVTGVFPTEYSSFQDTKELIGAYDQSHAEAVAKVNGLAAELWGEDVAPFGPESKMSRMSLLTLTTEHEIHHRGQLYVYLRMLGCEVPALFG